MSITRLTPCRTARNLSRGGFTLVELLVVIGIIAILAGVALGPITSGIEKAKESAAMQNARSINLLLFQYSNDNGAYPTGGTTAPGTSEGIAIQLLQNKYLSDPTTFYLAGVAGATKFTGVDYTTFAKTNIQWDFMAGATATTGLTSSANDLLPTVFCTGEKVNPVSGGVVVTLSGQGPFVKNGMAVAYHGNNASFLKATQNGATATVQLISPSYNDTSTYTQIVP